MKYLFNVLFLLASLACAREVYASDVYSLITNKCKLVQGFIISVDENHVEMLSTAGRHNKLRRNEIDFVEVHNTLENPIAKIKYNEKLKNRLLNVYTLNKNKPLFMGWAVRFIEELVMFYDTDGNTHVLDLYSISKLRPVSEMPKRKKLKFKGVRFNLGGVSSHCSKALSKFNRGLMSTRILGDKVQISEFFSSYNDGFFELESYTERTYLYAKPFLYEKKTRFGLYSPGSMNELPDSTFPFYFQWSRGREYRFQSFNQFGAASVEYSPTADPMVVFRTDLKSHIFHASFVGNLAALSAGTEFFTPHFDEYFSEKLEKSIYRSHAAPAFNYMAFMGGDWGPWSFSVGTYFPIYMVAVKDKDTLINEYREILGSHLAPIFRVMYTTDKIVLRAIASVTENDTKNVEDLDISRDRNSSAVSFIDEFKMDSVFLRVGGDYHFNDNLKFGLDQIYVNGQYRELLFSSQKNSFDFTHLTTHFYARQTFGEYVSIKAFGTYFISDRDFSMMGLLDKEHYDGVSFGGSFEFIF